MTDVARLAGVSVKTVSNVLNGYPHVRDATRDRVLTAVEQLGYRVNASARSLRRGRTDIIRLALPELRLPYFAELADSVIVAAEAAGLTVLVEQTGGERRREVDVLRGPRRHLADGLLFSPLALGPQDAPLLAEAGPLVVLGERIFGGPADHVTMDNVGAARAATEHLLGLGRRRVALLGTHPREDVGTASLREQGYREALYGAGIRPDPRLAVDVGPWHRDTGVQAMARVLDQHPLPDAVFALNDTLAIGALHALHARGLRVPDDVAVIGFDDTDDARYTNPPLSSVRPGRQQIATMAVTLLQERITGSGPGTPRLVTADYEVVPRASTTGDASTTM